jgi:hypothetical protein
MPRSSESVAALAAALAKAQAELVNPEKSLTAIMRTGGPGEGQRSFRYAPLSSGLDIVRKTLGRHEIATVQTTAIDQTAGMVNLTTTLAHASGEWIASDWPVCPIAETANPQRMGAALTYARRYALFTLVGIAGEDDLDAPDLCVEPPSLPSVVHRSLKPTDGQSWMPPRKPGNGHARNGLRREVPRTLDPDQSTAVREKLLTEIENIKSGDLAAGWARRALSAKNALIEADAKLVEDVFERRLSGIASSDPAASLHDGTFGTQVAEPQKTVPAESAESGQAKGIDKSVLTVATPRRYRNKEHLRYVAKQPCLVCARKPSDAHHLRFMQPRALGRKASDEFVVPLCRVHHRAVHRAGDERAWWNQAGIEPLKVACKLWKQTRVNEGRIAPDRTSAQAAESDSSLVSQDRATKVPA